MFFLDDVECPHIPSQFGWNVPWWITKVRSNWKAYWSDVVWIQKSQRTQQKPVDRWVANWMLWKRSWYVFVFFRNTPPKWNPKNRWFGRCSSFSHGWFLVFRGVHRFNYTWWKKIKRNPATEHNPDFLKYHDLSSESALPKSPKNAPMFDLDGSRSDKGSDEGSDKGWCIVSK